MSGCAALLLRLGGEGQRQPDRVLPGQTDPPPRRRGQPLPAQARILIDRGRLLINKKLRARLLINIE